MTFYLQGKIYLNDSGFLIEIFLEAIKEQHNIFQALKEKSCQSRICTHKNSSEMKGKIKTFSDKTKKNLVTSRLTLKIEKQKTKSKDLNRKEMITKRRNNTVTKKIGVNTDFPC